MWYLLLLVSLVPAQAARVQPSLLKEVLQNEKESCGAAKTAESCLTARWGSDCVWCPLTMTCHVTGSANNVCPSTCCASHSSRSSCKTAIPSEAEASCVLTKVKEDRSDLTKFQYNEEHAKTMAAYASAAYCHREKLWHWNCEGHCSKLSDTQEVWVIKRVGNNLVLFIAWDAKMKQIVVSFRGTQAPSILKNWLGANLHLGVTLTFPYKDLPKVGLHTGFWKAFQELKTEIVLTLREKLRAHPGASIILTGHSLGGALSTVAAFELAHTGFPIAEVMNFGSPRVGNIEFVAELHKLVPQFWRITHFHDPVVHMPPRLLLNYELYHSPGEVFYDHAKGLSHVVTGAAPEDMLGADQFESLGNYLNVDDHSLYVDVVMSSTQACSYKPEGRISYEAIPQSKEFSGPGKTSNSLTGKIGKMVKLPW